MRKLRTPPLLIGSILVLLCLQTRVAFSQTPQLKLCLFTSGLNYPTSISHAGDSRLFVVERSGTIRIVDVKGIVNPTPYLNIESLVDDVSSEQGLLGLAFHPNYSTNGYFYVYYIDNTNNTQISRFKVSKESPDLADATSEFKLLNIIQHEQQWWNLAF
jgi:glucose/arabinose dehydrogenase